MAYLLYATSKSQPLHTIGMTFKYKSNLMTCFYCTALYKYTIDIDLDITFQYVMILPRLC